MELPFEPAAGGALIGIVIGFLFGWGIKGYYAAKKKAVSA